MNISMIPNNDVKTIHASQGDTERVWHFVPYADGVINTSQDEYASFDSIKGNTLVWNQLVTNAVTPSTISGITFSRNGNLWSASGTATALATQALNGSAFQLRNGHKYLLKGCPSGGSASTYWFGLSGIKVDYGNGGIYNCTLADGTNAYPRFDIASGQTVNFSNMQFIVVDLTLMFGTGKEPTSVSEFTAFFPLPYYAYDSGSLLSFNGSGIKTTGFNQWDEEWEVGNWRSSDGQSGSLTDRIRSKNYIEVFPNKDYYFKSPVGIFTVICWYDESHAFISSTGGTASSVNTVFTSPANAKYMRFCMNDVYGTVYHNDICINISSSRNGEYEPYEESITTLPIQTYFPTGMKSAGSVYDELTPSKAITRTVGYTFTGDSVQGATKESNIWRVILKSDYYYDIGGLTYPQGVTNIYQVVNSYTAVNGTNMSVGFNNGEGKQILIRNDSFTSANDIITALNSTPLDAVLPIATPTETDISEDLTYPVEVGGTEELLPSALCNGVLDLGTQYWRKYTDVTTRKIYYATISGMDSTSAQLTCDGLTAVPWGSLPSMAEKTIQAHPSLNIVYACDSSCEDATEFTSAMSGVYLWYEKSDNTPSTTPIKADIRYPDGVQSVEFTYKQTEFESQIIKGYMVCKGLEIEGETDENGITIQSTSELTSEPGFFDCKLKLTQGDGVCYSTKFQLHVERRP